MVGAVICSSPAAATLCRSLAALRRGGGVAQLALAPLHRQAGVPPLAPARPAAAVRRLTSSRAVFAASSQGVTKEVVKPGDGATFPKQGDKVTGTRALGTERVQERAS
jgi:hypothetical protein